MIKQTSTNPIANLLMIAAGIVAIGVFVVLGFVAFLVLAAVISIAAAILGIRMWWFNRGLRGQAGRDAGSQGAAGVIEGEYRVIDRDRDEA